MEIKGKSSSRIIFEAVIVGQYGRRVNGIGDGVAWDRRGRFFHEEASALKMFLAQNRKTERESISNLSIVTSQAYYSNQILSIITSLH